MLQGYLQHIHNDTYAPNITLLAIIMGTDHFWGCQPSRKNNINNTKKCITTKHVLMSYILLLPEAKRKAADVEINNVQTLTIHADVPSL